jgi:hypothetical protein
MSEIIEPQKDAFGFPIKVKEPDKEINENIPWGKIAIWILIALGICFHIFLCCIAGYLCYTENKDGSYYIVKVIFAVIFNYFYLLYKGASKIVNLYLKSR